jgi:hypothetical protein
MFCVDPLHKMLQVVLATTPYWVPLKQGHMFQFDHNKTPGQSLNQVDQDA